MYAIKVIQTRYTKFMKCFIEKTFRTKNGFHNCFIHLPLMIHWLTCNQLWNEDINFFVWQVLETKCCTYLSIGNYKLHKEFNIILPFRNNSSAFENNLWNSPSVGTNFGGKILSEILCKITLKLLRNTYTHFDLFSLLCI